MTNGNKPILPGLYADPDVLVYGGRYYLYPTTDGIAHWAGTTFHAFSSDDRRVWKDEGIILDVSTNQVPWAVGSAWAPAIFARGGKFYFYFCAKRADNASCIGVAVSNAPTHGFRAMLQPLITPELLREKGVVMSQTIDPSVYAEKGAVYLLFGNGSPAIVRLSDDLVRVEPDTMQNLSGTEDFREAITVCKRGGVYHFTWSCDDTGSPNYHVNYGTAAKLYGPIQTCYPVLKQDPALDILGPGHHCIFKEPGTDSYYMAYHRFATPTGNYPEGKGWHREVCLTPIEFGSDGRMKPVRFR